jgi:membrane-associated phospholipid phosphatase
LGSGGFRDVNDFARDTGWLHPVLSNYATYGAVLLGVLLVVGYWWARGTGRLPQVAAAVWAIVGMAVAVALNQLVVHAVDEPRPFVALSHVLLLVHHSTDPGFPSDHAVMAGAAAAGLFFVSRALGWVTSAAAVVMAFARVYVGVHYPQDVLAGLALGAVVILVGGLLARPVLLLLLSALARTPLRALVVSGRSIGLAADTDGQ